MVGWRWSCGPAARATTEIHIGQGFEQLHHVLYILQGKHLLSTIGASTPYCIELITDGVDGAEQGIVESGAAGAAWIIHGIWKMINIVSES